MAAEHEAGWGTKPECAHQGDLAGAGEVGQQAEERGAGGRRFKGHHKRPLHELVVIVRR